MKFKTIIFCICIYILIDLHLSRKVTKKDDQSEGIVKGYNYFTGKYADAECFKYKSKEEKHSQLDVEFTKTLTKDTLKNIFDGKTQGTIKVVETDLNLENQFGENNSSQNFYYIINYLKNFKYNYNLSNIDKFISQDYIDLYKSSHNRFLDQCGNYLKDEESLGVVLIIQYQVTFDESDKKNDLKIKGDNNSLLSLFNFKADIKKKMEQNGIKGTISMKAKQYGGDPTKLLDILGETCEQIITDHKTKDIEQVNEKCDTKNSLILDYIKNDFKQQLNLPIEKFKVFSGSIKKSHLELNLKLQEGTTSEVISELNYKINDIEKKNNYYISNMDKFRTNSKEYFDNVDQDFIKSFYDLFSKLNQNKQIINRNQDNFCRGDVKECSKENFYKYYNKIDQKIFSSIDTLMEQLKFVIDYNLELGVCELIKVYCKRVTIRVVPLGNNKFIPTTANTSWTNEPEWKLEIIKFDKANDFSFKFDFVTDYKIAPISKGFFSFLTNSKENPLEVSVKSSYRNYIIFGTQKINPIYFKPYIVEEKKKFKRSQIKNSIKK